jgi:hypothetical protein
MKKIVTISFNGYNYFLKKKSTTAYKPNADRFDTIEDAQKAIDRARKFNYPALIELMRIVDE